MIDKKERAICSRTNSKSQYKQVIIKTQKLMDMLNTIAQAQVTNTKPTA